MSSTNENNKINGIVINIDNVEFVGFCKSFYSNEIQTISVFIGDKKIDEIVADGSREFLQGYAFWELYDIEKNHCFSYKFPQEYWSLLKNIKFKNSNDEEMKIIQNEK